MRGKLLNQAVSQRVEMVYERYIEAETEAGRRASWASIARTMAPLVIPHKWAMDQRKAQEQVRNAMKSFSNAENPRSWSIAYLEAFAHATGVDWRVLLDVPTDTLTDPKAENAIEVADLLRRAVAQPKLTQIVLDVAGAVLRSKGRDEATRAIFTTLNEAEDRRWKWKSRSEK